MNDLELENLLESLKSAPINLKAKERIIKNSTESFKTHSQGFAWWRRLIAKTQGGLQMINQQLRKLKVMPTAVTGLALAVIMGIYLVPHYMQEAEINLPQPPVVITPTVPVTKELKPKLKIATGVPVSPALSGLGVQRTMKREYFEGTGDVIAYEVPQPSPYVGKDKFQNVEVNPIQEVSDKPVSTFSMDVDTASYAFVRRMINEGVLPQKNAVRVEEMINYFPYDYKIPEDKNKPFATTVAVYPTPWNANTKLIHIGIKGYELKAEQKPNSNLVFLIDTSGSMESPDKLPLLIRSFKLLVDQLKPEDTVGIVVYAGSAGTVLEPTPAKNKSKILAALNKLQAGGSTAGGQGIALAYELAQQNFDKEKVNRVILATDGDFNVGITDVNELKSFIEHKRATGIYLSILGFGQGNYNDQLMQTLAQNGNGTAAYIDNIREAQKILITEASSTLFPIAKDAKIQIEFNPKYVSEYRLIGYETRLLKKEDFNNDAVDAGDIGSGHVVTAIYEIAAPGSKGLALEPNRYQKVQKTNSDLENNEIAFLKIRYKLPNQNTSQLIERPITTADEVDTVNKVSTEVRFAAAVAAYGQALQLSPYLKDFSYDQILTLAKNSTGEDPYGYRSEFINLVRQTKGIK
jgi:Ca-activated chloride channel family protein